MLGAQAELITERVELILSGKNELELDELAKKLRGEENEAWVLTLSTSYGDKRFQLDDVKHIVLSRGDRRMDVTEAVTEKIREV